MKSIVMARALVLSACMCGIAGVQLSYAEMPMACPGKPAGEWGQRDHGRSGGRGHEMIQKLLDELDLNAEQKQKIMEYQKEAALKREETHRIMRDKMQEMHSELERYETDMNKINRLIDELSVNHKTMLSQRVEDIMQMKQILTKEQCERMQQKMAEERSLWREKKRSWKMHSEKDGPPPLEQ